MFNMSLTRREVTELYLLMRSVPHMTPSPEVSKIEYEMFEYLRKVK